MSLYDLDPETVAYICDAARLRHFLKGLCSAPGKRVSQQRMWSSLSRAYPLMPQGPESRAWLVEALAALEALDKIRLPVQHGQLWDRTSAIPVPSVVFIVQAEEPKNESDWREFPWHPKLQWILERRYLPADQESFLKRIHRGLVELEFNEPASFKYRSLQLTGDEKRLASLVKSQLFAPDRLTLELIGCEEDVLPLAIESVSGRPNLLIFENAGAFMVALRTLRDSAISPFGNVAYGGGEQVLKSIAYLQFAEQRIDEIEYVGDLDPKGLRIASQLQKVARRRSLPPVLPATFLHRAMLDSAVQLGAPAGWPAPAERSIPSTLHAVGFVDPGLSAAVSDIITQRHRIPEEVLGHREMRAAFCQPTPKTS